MSETRVDTAAPEAEPKRSLIERILHYGYDPHTGDATLLWNMGRAFSRICCSRWFDLKVYGTENIPKRGGVLLVANHQSYLDPVVVGVQLKRPVSFFAKSQLFTNRYFGWLIRNLHAFPVRQGTGDVRAMKQAIGRLKEGHMLNVFPEGGRTLDGSLQRIEPGVALMVRRAEVPIVPTAIIGSYEAWPKGRKIFRQHPVRVMFGPPLNLAGLKTEEIVRLIEHSLVDLVAQLREREKSHSVAYAFAKPKFITEAAMPK